MRVRLYQKADQAVWDAYVQAHPAAILYHLSGWRDVIGKTYGHNTYYLMAIKNDSRITGILPLIHLKHFLFGNSLISMPFFDLGGILADDEETESALLAEAIKEGKKLRAKTIELRHTKRVLERLSDLSGFADDNLKNSTMPGNRAGPSTRSAKLRRPSMVTPDPGVHIDLKFKDLVYATKSHKVRMLLELPDSSEALMKSFKSKLRSQIRKPIKEGLSSKVGRTELLDGFYRVFSANMRDLGSPVHSKELIANVLEAFPETSKIVMVYKGDFPLACSLIIGFRDTLENPWASSLRKYSRLSPNMLLYWTMLDYACVNGFRYFDFGRSSPDEGTFRFKEQWGAQAKALHWHYISLNGGTVPELVSEKSKLMVVTRIWERLPVPITEAVGPRIRKHIGL